MGEIIAFAVLITVYGAGLLAFGFREGLREGKLQAEPNHCETCVYWSEIAGGVNGECAIWSDPEDGIYYSTPPCGFCHEWE